MFKEAKSKSAELVKLSNVTYIGELSPEFLKSLTVARKRHCSLIACCFHLFPALCK